MHLNFADALNLVSTLGLIGMLASTGMQVRSADSEGRDLAAMAGGVVLGYCSRAQAWAEERRKHTSREFFEWCKWRQWKWHAVAQDRPASMQSANGDG